MNLLRRWPKFSLSGAKLTGGMRGRRDILISTLLVGLQLMAPAALIAPSALAQPGPVSVPATPPDAGIRGRLQTLLPAPSTTAQLMVPRSVLSVLQVQQRVAQVGGDLRILESILGQVKQGYPYTYDERVGISRTELQNLLIFQKTLEASGRQARFALSQSGTRLMFGDIAGAGILKGMSIDVQSGELFTQEGFSARPRVAQVTAALDGTGMGASSGLAWDVKGSNGRSQNALQGHLSLLQFGGGQVLLSYNRVSILKGRISEDSVNLLYRK